MPTKCLLDGHFGHPVWSRHLALSRGPVTCADGCSRCTGWQLRTGNLLALQLPLLRPAKRSRAVGPANSGGNFPGAPRTRRCTRSGACELRATRRPSPAVGRRPAGYRRSCTSAPGISMGTARPSGRSLHLHGSRTHPGVGAVRHRTNDSWRAAPDRAFRCLGQLADACGGAHPIRRRQGEAAVCFDPFHAVLHERVIGVATVGCEASRGGCSSDAPVGDICRLLERLALEVLVVPEDVRSGWEVLDSADYCVAVAFIEVPGLEVVGEVDGL